MDAKKIGELLKSSLIWFVIFWVGMMAAQKFFPAAEGGAGNIEVSSAKKSMVLGGYPLFNIENNLDKKISFISPCDAPDALKVFAIIGGQKMPIFPNNELSGCSNRKIDSFELAAGESTKFDFRQFSADIFKEPGNYFAEMSFKVAGSETVVIESNKIEVSEPGILRQLFRGIISSLLFNTLVFFINTLPGHSLGLAIISLTLLVRLVLFIPNQKAMRSQRELQKLQPKLEELKKKHGKNQQVLAMKTMELYKSHKINPMSSCLPMLFQMPFLIGLYTIIKDGMSPHLTYLLWEPLKNFDFTSANMDFLMWQLDKPEKMFLPVLVGVAQFLAIKLSMISAAKKKKTEKAVANPQADQMAQMQKMMLYVMPVMIGFFTSTFPAGVGIYWLTSTIFGIFQQKLVNWQLDRPQVRRKTD